ncbi:unnamed protein product (macronuclear) [Paramecium tetraurelia]|uniref:PiggyBac transposable element-derived protein domain-containing protein n=1 Tax=Paramecium tetraurelia TaxID=5888 RepID=A0BGL4_PARTE|nr:uncharacterized protein GSPATT00028716001 [Paramecium tetraurelia]CAK57681.1 unnamed protein product [Paramecium tetraurelia]|eukprot:XP_001425079.1 hypothetical protein (macronuclear) [Paramecium tetraurelia strain d4-2]
MEATLCQILAENYTQETNKYSTIIVFQRYSSDKKCMFFIGYDSNSFIIIQQQHYQVDEMDTNLDIYFKRVYDFLYLILFQKKEVTIHFINILIIKDFDHFYQLFDLEGPFPKSKIIVWIEHQQQLDIRKQYLSIQISFNYSALIKIQFNLLIKDLGAYKQFAIKQISQMQESHQQFLQQFENCLEQVKAFKFLTLIKEITFLKEIPDQIEYFAQILMNLPRYTSLDAVVIIAKLKLYKQKANFNRTNNQQKLKINEYLEITQTDLRIFKELKYCHFPKRGDNSQKCKVCQKNSDKVRKSSFVCEACKLHYKINVTLCTTKCFKLFHLNPEKYLRRKNRSKNTKVEE